MCIAADQGGPGLIAGLAGRLGVGLLNSALIVAFGVPSLVLTMNSSSSYRYGIVVCRTNGKGLR